MKLNLKKWICFILVLFLFTALYSCNDSSSTATESTKSGTAGPTTSSSTESSKSTQSAATSPAITSSTSDEANNILSKDDVLLTTIDINGSKRYICVNEKLNGNYDPNAKSDKFDFAILSDLKQSVKPTLVRKGDTFMNWKITEVSAYFTYYEDGRMYPTSNITIKMEGNFSCEAAFNYDFYDANNREVMIVKTEIKDFELFPYPIYTKPVYSPSLPKESNYKYEFEVDNVSEIVQKYNLKHGNFKGNVKVKTLSINYDQAGGTHYYSATVESIDISK